MLTTTQIVFIILFVGFFGSLICHAIWVEFFSDKKKEPEHEAVANQETPEAVGMGGDTEERFEEKELVDARMDALKKQLDYGDSVIRINGATHGVVGYMLHTRLLQELKDRGYRKNQGSTEIEYEYARREHLKLISESDAALDFCRKTSGLIEMKTGLTDTYFTTTIGPGPASQTLRGTHCGIAPGVVYSGTAAVSCPAVLIKTDNDTEFFSKPEEATHAVDVTAFALMPCISDEVIALMREEEFNPHIIKVYRTLREVVVELHSPTKAFVFSSEEAYDYTIDYSDVTRDPVTLHSVLKTRGSPLGTPIQIGGHEVRWYSDASVKGKK